MINYIVPTGTILEKYMQARKISKNMLAKITNSSEKHVLEVISGKVPFSREFALKLEKVFPDVNALFWLELEAQYQLDKLKENNN